jgi:hypothetical protein
VRQWEEAPDQHYKAIGSQKSGRRWTAVIIKKMWDVEWDLWEQRNGFAHSKENEGVLHNMAEVDAEIQYQFQQGPVGLLQRVQYLFAGRVDDLLQILHPYSEGMAADCGRHSQHGNNVNGKREECFSPFMTADASMAWMTELMRVDAEANELRWDDSLF